MYMVSFIVKLKIFKFVLYWFRIYEMTQHICGTFHQYSRCGCEIFKIFKFVLYWFSIYEIIHFWDFLGSYSPKHCLILLKLWPDVVSNKKNSFWKILQNLEFLLKWNAVEVYSFGPYWRPIYRRKTKNIAKNQNFCKNCILRNN